MVRVPPRVHDERPGDETEGYLLAEMQPVAYAWSEIESDTPVPRLTRWKVTGDHCLVAKIRLEKGCLVVPHRHASEQMSILISGRLRWALGEPGTPEYRETIVDPGQVLHIPAHALHGVIEVIEEAEVFDILSPPGAMGVDSQGR